MKAILFAAALAVTGLPACAAPVAERQKPVTISNDPGGDIAEYVARRQKLAASGRPVVIRGKCYSSCTILITLPNACLDPKAVIGFHQPSAGNGRGMPLLNPLIAHYYRNGILDMWNRKWSRSTRLAKISAKDYVRLDPQTRLCR
ncbi:hypothetical protein [Paenirhodobacter sp.]|uniref:hypothetical protein n=1 Tax=Paenirhodobacter sp. TaxID=1965326 RepID=UPI003B407C11